MRRLNNGFTLVELMIAIAISIIMVAGLIQILIANRQAYRVMEGANFMQENMRFSVERLTYAARMAAHWGAIKPANLIGANVPGSNTPCSPGWARELGRPIVAWNGSSTAPSALADCFDAANYEPNTDIVAMRYAESDPVLAGSPLDPGQLYVVTQAHAGQGAIFLGSSGIPTLPNRNAGGVESRPQTRVSAVSAELFWVRRCNDPGPDNACGNSDDGDFENPIPTLMRGYLDTAGNWLSEPIADGAEQLQIEFQFERGPWFSADNVPNSAPSALRDPWAQLGGVRIAGIARSSQRDNSFPEDVRTFPLSGDVTAHSVSGVAAKTLRTRFESTVSMRNHYRTR